ncbi:hypothetical protein SDRG_14741 [Saprolegnia diclina VS20]|uniref:MATE family multidrug resistance protein n=1 Tax=Saprolegnia diclina (strain VS20) TaxID=1156394 RepID=T0Q216_SAPDV|nr:hypothetical protein SDRG_14741 [Saprolegnia diclina VS20]EQC27415.1 hypothetical protein SDRG_14741 [Saprolegnia diclina VS20]|eukprot:XP_008619115.1 hypothetical protein SDRG_14741 [Saprolegnia diclina VS20]
MRPDDNFCVRVELWPFLWLALQLAIEGVARFALYVIDAAFVGHIGTDEFAGASLATIWVELPLCTFWGMASALTALCGQAYGAKNYVLMGIWLQMALVLVTVCAIPTTIYYGFVDVFLRFASDDSTVVALGARFGALLSPSVWPQLVYVCLRKYLQAMAIVTPTTINGVVSIGLDIGANYLLIYGADLGFDGSPLATVFVSWFQPIALFGYCCVYKAYHKASWGGWAFSELTWVRWQTFLRMALPLGLNSGWDTLVTAALSLIVAKLGPDTIATQAILANVWMVVDAIFRGVAVAAEVGLAAHLGGGRPRAARTSAMFGFGVLLVVALLVCLVLWSTPAAVVGIFTPSQKLLAIYETVLPMYMVTLVVDAIEIGVATSLEGMGHRQMRLVTTVTVIGLWGVQLPLAYYLGQVQDYGLFGVWAAMALAIAAKALILGVCFLRIDWAATVADAMVTAEVTQSSTELNDVFVLERKSGSIHVLSLPDATPNNSSENEWDDDKSNDSWYATFL